MHLSGYFSSCCRPPVRVITAVSHWFFYLASSVPSCLWQALWFNYGAYVDVCDSGDLGTRPIHPDTFALRNQMLLHDAGQVVNADSQFFLMSQRGMTAGALLLLKKSLGWRALLLWLGLVQSCLFLRPATPKNQKSSKIYKRNKINVEIKPPKIQVYFLELCEIKVKKWVVLWSCVLISFIKQ